jgi:formylglycine-generating enzyme required for sulfatase activity
MSTKFHHLFIVLVLLAGVNPVLAQTTPLSIALAGNQVVISWPAAAVNCFLQSTTNLSPAAWSNVSAAPVVISGQYTVTNPISGTQQFYQLSQTAIPGGMALIPAGVFTMGDTLDGESDAIPISVTVSAFYMDTNLVSYSQWLSVYAYATSHGYGFDYAGSGKAANQPVQTVDWFDVAK